MWRWIDPRFHPFLRFVLVGGLNFLLTLAVYEVALLVMDYRLAYLVSFPVGTVFTTVLNIKSVFGRHLEARTFATYGIYYCLYTGVSMLVLQGVVEGLAVPRVWAPVLVQMVVIPLHFLLSRYIILRGSVSAATGKLSERDIGELGRMQCEVLFDFLVSRLGARYAAAYWRYVDRTGDEIALVRRDEEGHVAAACSVSLRPKLLTRRLATRTPLVLYVLPHVLSQWFLRTLAGFLSGGGDDLPDMPELVMLMTDPRHRREGMAQALVIAAEAELAARGATRYYVKTAAHQTDAHAFYLANGFHQIARTEFGGMECLNSGRGFCDTGVTLRDGIGMVRRRRTC